MLVDGVWPNSLGDRLNQSPCEVEICCNEAGHITSSTGWSIVLRKVTFSSEVRHTTSLIGGSKSIPEGKLL